MQTYGHKIRFLHAPPSRVDNFNGSRSAVMVIVLEGQGSILIVLTLLLLVPSTYNVHRLLFLWTGAANIAGSCQLLFFPSPNVLLFDLCPIVLSMVQNNRRLNSKSKTLTATAVLGKRFKTCESLGDARSCPVPVLTARSVLVVSGALVGR